MSKYTKTVFSATDAEKPYISKSLKTSPYGGHTGFSSIDDPSLSMPIDPSVSAGYSSKVIILAEKLKYQHEHDKTTQNLSDEFYLQYAQRQLNLQYSSKYGNISANIDDVPDPAYAQYSYEEIISMANNGVNIPKAVLAWAKAQQEADITDYIVISDNIDGAPSNNKSSDESDINKIRAEAKDFAIKSKKAQEDIEISKEKNNVLINQALDISKKQKKSLKSDSIEQIEKTVKELKILDNKKKTSGKLSQSENAKYKDLSKKLQKNNEIILNLKKNSGTLDDFLESIDGLNDKIKEGLNTSQKAIKASSSLSSTDNKLNSFTTVHAYKTASVNSEVLENSLVNIDDSQIAVITAKIAQDLENLGNEISANLKNEDIQAIVNFADEYVTKAKDIGHTLNIDIDDSQEENNTIKNENKSEQESLLNSEQEKMEVPVQEPTVAPEQEPTKLPSEEPTVAPEQEPTTLPSEEPTVAPEQEPTELPSKEPTVAPEQEPTELPSKELTVAPEQEPTELPSEELTVAPEQEPTTLPMGEPTVTIEKEQNAAFQEGTVLTTPEGEPAFALQNEQMSVSEQEKSIVQNAELALEQQLIFETKDTNTLAQEEKAIVTDAVNPNSAQEESEPLIEEGINVSEQESGIQYDNIANPIDVGTNLIFEAESIHKNVTENIQQNVKTNDMSYLSQASNNANKDSQNTVTNNIYPINYTEDTQQSENNFDKSEINNNNEKNIGTELNIENSYKNTNIVNQNEESENSTEDNNELSEVKEVISIDKNFAQQQEKPENFDNSEINADTVENESDQKEANYDELVQENSNIADNEKFETESEELIKDQEIAKNEYDTLVEKEKYNVSPSYVRKTAEVSEGFSDTSLNTELDINNPNDVKKANEYADTYTRAVNNFDEKAKAAASTNINLGNDNENIDVKLLRFNKDGAIDSKKRVKKVNAVSESRNGRNRK